MDVEQLQNLSSTEYLVLFCEEFRAFHKLRLKKSVTKACLLARKSCFSIGTRTQWDLAHDVTNMNQTLSKNPSLLDTKTTLCWQTRNHDKISLSWNSALSDCCYSLLKHKCFFILSLLSMPTKIYFFNGAKISWSIPWTFSIKFEKECNALSSIFSWAKLMFCTAEVVEGGSEPYFCSPTLELARNQKKPLWLGWNYLILVPCATSNSMGNSVLVGAL